MIINFSQYLINHGIRADVNHSTFSYHANEWFSDLMQAFIQFAKFFPPIFLPVFIRGSLKSSDFKIIQEIHTILASNESHAILIKKLDDYFKGIMNFLNCKAIQYSSISPISVEKGFYPYDAKISGVSILCRIRLINGSLLDGVAWEARSALGASGSESKAIRERAVSAISKGACAWLNQALKNLDVRKTHVDLIDSSQPHAEDDWFLQYGEALLDVVKKNKEILNNPLANNYFPASFLQGPRIEFIITSTPCTDCQFYFRALGQALKDLDIHLPIVIFAHSAFNTYEKDCAIFVINQACDYQMLPFQWLGPKLLSNAPVLRVQKKVVPEPMLDIGSVNLNSKYRTVLILSTFGDAFLPTLARVSTSIQMGLINSLLDYQSTSHTMLDWVKNYFRQLLLTLPYDFTNTSAKNLSLPEEYPEVDLRFLSCYKLSPSILEYAKSIAQVAAYKNNAILFFIAISAYKDWKKMLYEFLKRSDEPSPKKIKVSEALKNLICEVRDNVYWDISNAPAELIYYPKYEDVPNMISSEPVLEFYRYSSFFLSFIHFIRVPILYQRNILNAMLTHPAQSPLRNENVNYNNEKISLLIHQIRNAIYQLAYFEGKWNLSVVEKIFKSFENKEFEPELYKIIQEAETPKEKSVVLIERIFSQEQVASNSHSSVSIGTEIYDDISNESEQNNDDEEEDKGPGYVDTKAGISYYEDRKNVLYAYEKDIRVAEMFLESDNATGHVLVDKIQIHEYYRDRGIRQHFIQLAIDKYGKNFKVPLQDSKPESGNVEKIDFPLGAALSKSNKFFINESVTGLVQDDLSQNSSSFFHIKSVHSTVINDSRINIGKRGERVGRHKW